jgi:hypothetical protein
VDYLFHAVISRYVNDVFVNNDNIMITIKDTLTDAGAMASKALKWPSSSAVLADVLRWSREKHVPMSQIIGSGLGMSIPIAVGVASGHLEIGLMASLGGLALSSAAGNGKLRQQSVLLCYALITGIAAILIGSTVSGHGWLTGAVIIIMAFMAAMIGGMGRAVARSSSMFMVFIIIGSGLGSTHNVDSVGVTLVFTVGALWTIMVALGLSILFRSIGVESISPSGPSGSIAGGGKRTPTLRQQTHHWVRLLRTKTGWLFALRLSLCVAAAEMVAALWSQPTSYWIPLVVILIVQRNHEIMISRAAKRAIGTLAGVVIGSVLLLLYHPEWFLVLAIGVLAALRPFLRERNYALYSMVMTPLIVIVLEFGNDVSSMIMVYRFIDTMIGVSIAIFLGYAIWPSCHLKPGMSPIRTENS